MLLDHMVLMQNLMMEDLVQFKMDLTFKGDKNGSKWSTAKREIPRALETTYLI